MMIRYVGRSGETHRLKNKPINQDYKFFVLADSCTWYVVNSTPDSRLAAVRGRNAAAVNEYGLSSAEKVKTVAMISHLVEPLVPLSIDSACVDFVVAMDNYFTLKRVILLLLH